MQAVLYIGHGSRMAGACEQLTIFLRNVMKEVPVPIQEISFLEFARPTIAEGIERCVKRGATQIAIMPFLLLTASHTKHDIPSEIEVMKKRYPYITFHYGRPLGIHSKIIDLLADKISDHVPEDQDACIVLVGRGSRDNEQLVDFRKIAALLSKKLTKHQVKVGFLYSASPSLENTLQYAKATGKQKIIVVPYILFIGLLMKKIKESVQVGFSDHFDVTVCSPLGYHYNIKEVLLERVQEVIERADGLRKYA